MVKNFFKITDFKLRHFTKVVLHRGCFQVSWHHISEELFYNNIFSSCFLHVNYFIQGLFRDRIAGGSAPPHTLFCKVGIFAWWVIFRNIGGPFKWKLAPSFLLLIWVLYFIYFSHLPIHKLQVRKLIFFHHFAAKKKVRKNKSFLFTWV